MIDELGYTRPQTRADCKNVPRPCPYVSCKFNLYLDADEETGAIRFNHPGVEPHELEETCALDVAERGGITLDETAKFVGLTRERVRQIELAAEASLVFECVDLAPDGWTADDEEEE